MKTMIAIGKALGRADACAARALELCAVTRAKLAAWRMLAEVRKER